MFKTDGMSAARQEICSDDTPALPAHVLMVLAQHNNAGIVERHAVSTRESIDDGLYYRASMIVPRVIIGGWGMAIVQPEAPPGINSERTAQMTAVIYKGATPQDVFTAIAAGIKEKTDPATVPDFVNGPHYPRHPKVSDVKVARIFIDEKKMAEVREWLGDVPGVTMGGRYGIITINVDDVLAPKRSAEVRAEPVAQVAQAAVA